MKLSEPQHQTMTVSQAINLASNKTQTRQYKAALRICQKILDAIPSHPMALNLIGVNAHLMQRLHLADRFLRFALAVNPFFFEAFFNLGNVRIALKRVDDALGTYRAAIRMAPQFADAHYNLGNVLKESKQLEAARYSHIKAIALDFHHAGAHNNLGNVLRISGKDREALFCFNTAVALGFPQAATYNNIGNGLREQGDREPALLYFVKAVALNPEFAEGHKNLGMVFYSLERTKEAISTITNALRIDPSFSEAHYHFGTYLGKNQRYEPAALCYIKRLALDPAHVESHINLGAMLTNLKRNKEAATIMRWALRLEPCFPAIFINLGKARYETGLLEAAQDCFRKAIALDPVLAEAYSNLGTVLKDLGNVNGAQTSFESAITQNPDYAQAHFNLGVTKLELGQAKEALTSINRAIDIDPNYGEAHRMLTFTKNFSDDLASIQDMVSLYDKPDLNEEHKMHLAFALGKAFEDIAQYEKSFDFILRGNRARRNNFDFSIQDHDNFFRTIQSTFTPDLLAKHKEAAFSEAGMVFVLGMPRSGTTLVEQILSSHPDVFGAGELPSLLRFSQKFLFNLGESAAKADTKAFRSVGRAYLDTIRSLAGTKQYIIDKMPANFILIGIIKIIFPGSKIIHCKRDPMDTCWSIFKNYFHGDGNHFAYDLEELGKYYVSYSRLMAYWHRLFPGAIHDVGYEDLTADQETGTKAMLGYIGLEWTPACLHFHKNERAVKTASVTQVRKPIYRSSVGKWKRYASQLAPLRKILDDGHCL